MVSTFGRRDRKAPETGILVSTLSRSSLASGIVLLFNLQLSTAHGEIVGQFPAAVHVTLEIEAWPRRPLHIKRRLAELLPHVLAAVTPTVDELGRQRLESVQSPFETADDRLRRRARAMLEAHDSAARQLVQTGLFDRRSVRTSDRERSAGDLLDDEARTTAAGARALVTTAALRGMLVVSRRS